MPPAPTIIFSNFSPKSSPFISPSPDQHPPSGLIPLRVLAVPICCAMLQQFPFCNFSLPWTFCLSAWAWPPFFPHGHFFPQRLYFGGGGGSPPHSFFECRLPIPSAHNLKPLPVKPTLFSSMEACFLEFSLVSSRTEIMARGFTQVSFLYVHPDFVCR